MLTSALQISQCIRIRRVWFRAEIACYIYVYMFKTNESNAAKLQLRGGQYNLAVAKKRKLQLVEWEWAVQFPTVLQKSEKLQKLRTGSQYNLLLDSCFFPLQKCEKLQKLQLEDRGTILHCVAKKWKVTRSGSRYNLPVSPRPPPTVLPLQMELPGTQAAISKIFRYRQTKVQSKTN